MLADLGFAGLDLDRPHRHAVRRRRSAARAGRAVPRPAGGADPGRADQQPRPAGPGAGSTDALERWRGPVVVVSHDRELLDLVDQIAELRDGDAPGLRRQLHRVHRGPGRRAGGGRARGPRRPSSDLRRQSASSPRAGSSSTGGSGTPAARPTTSPRSWRRQEAGGPGVGRQGPGRPRGRRWPRPGGTCDAAEDRVRDDDVIRIDLTATAVPAGRDVLVADEVACCAGPACTARSTAPARAGAGGWSAANGSGKTTLIDTILGEVAPVAGSAAVRVPVRRAAPAAPAAARRRNRPAGRRRPSAARRRQQLRARLAAFPARRRHRARPVGHAVRRRTVPGHPGRAAAGEPPPQLLILDEPTNSLDLDSVAQLAAALRPTAGRSGGQPRRAVPGRDRS